MCIALAEERDDWSSLVEPHWPARSQITREVCELERNQAIWKGVTQPIALLSLMVQYHGGALLRENPAIACQAVWDAIEAVGRISWRSTNTPGAGTLGNFRGDSETKISNVHCSQGSIGQGQGKTEQVSSAFCILSR